LVDLSFHLAPGLSASATALPADLAVLMAGVAARQAMSPTALVQARLEGDEAAARFAFAHNGAFNTAAAQVLVVRAKSEGGIYRAVSVDVQDHGLKTVPEVKGSGAPPFEVAE
jgi:hypothetical protein